VTSAEDATYSGCPLTSKTDEYVDQVKELVHGNRRTTIHSILGISFGTVDSILKDNLNMHQIATKSVPHNC
jgi:hypothetical protein